eukprot:CAMPEP_0197827388 /NCGR_PEP_ID=MMETSP1437-20131217/4182_1 /TAXON_ID=49252 ORGANISM="Eucampia antarctica, Strain CCMP1452" /NCGR_SAMPLE_ID=MMETSP1437 /ASSEMBLY_ACC=CAM_ASM_001096 /LENGTH=122 /DNA_ID=CAMNT_0043428217 /DNA_START=89 /DNA_END=454 /DNA_ORIENTATION=-
MKKQWSVVISVLFLILSCIHVEAFSSSSTFAGRQVVRAVARNNNVNNRNSQLQMFFGAAKDDGTPGDYVCKDCGYVFTKGPKAWAKLDDDKYACPPCGAPKFRFKKVPKGSEKGTVKVKKSW